MGWFSKDKYAELLADAGFYRLSQRQRSVLRKVLLGSLVFHVGVMVIFGSWKLVSHLIPDKTVFEVPKVMKTYEPRKLEFKVKVSKRQRSSSRPSMVPRMISVKPSALNLPEIKMDPKMVKASFQPKFRAVSGKGLGVGLGTGFGEGGFGEGVSTFDFLGIRGQGQMVAILVDVSVSMVEDIRGGPKGFQRVRERLGKVVDALGEKTLFNVIVFADACSTFVTNMVPATEDNKSKAKQFLRGFNTQGNYGLTSGNYQAPKLGLPAAGGTTRLDLALDAAFEQGADTILIISDGLPRVRKVVTPEQARAHAALVESWYAQNAERIRAWEEQNAQWEATAQKVWIPPTPARPPQETGLKEGVEPDRGTPAQPGHWEISRAGRPPRPQPPILEPGWWTLADFLQHLKMLHEALYAKRGKKPPVIHAIGYAIDPEGGAFLKGLTDAYKGRYRRVAKID